MGKLTALGRVTQYALAGLAVVASLLAVAAALAPQQSQQQLAAVLLAAAAVSVLLVALRRQIAGALLRLAGYQPAVLPIVAIERTGLDVSVTVGRLPAKRRVRFAQTPGAKPPLDWYQLQWRLQFTTRRDLRDAFVALYHDVELSKRAEADPDCLFRWHATVYERATVDAFSLSWMAIDGQRISIIEDRADKTVSYHFEPASALENPLGRDRLVSLAVTLARTDRGGELMIPISVGVPTRGVRLTVDASILGNPSFDIQDGLQVPAGSPSFKSWAVLFGRANRAVAGVSGGTSDAVAQGRVTFVITPRLEGPTAER